MTIGTYLSIITLNVNGLNATIKTHRVAEWIRKQGPYMYCLQDTHLRTKDTQTRKGWKNTFHTNGNEKKKGVVVLISDKIDFKTKT